MVKKDSYTDLMNKTVKEKINQLIARGWEKLRKLDLIKTRETAEEIVKVSEENKYDKGFMAGYYLMGLVEVNLNRFDTALDYYFKALNAILKTQDSITISMAYENIGRCYGRMENYEECLIYFLKAKEHHSSSSLLQNIAECYQREGKFKEAKEYYRKFISSIPKSPTAINPTTIINAKLSLFNIYYADNEITKAKECLQDAAKFPELQEEIVKQVVYYCSSALLNLKESHLELAGRSLEMAENLAVDIKILEVRDNIYRTKLEILKAKQQFKEAYKLSNEFISFKRETLNSELTERITSIQRHYDQEISQKEAKRRQIKQNKLEIERKLKTLHSIYTEVFGIGKIGVFSDKMRSILKMADFFNLDRNVPVLIEGETGTGKEIIARIIHYGKVIDEGPFVTLNCSAISESLFESELFGYSEGAFTGAISKGRRGKLEQANGGTLFLDEIGELPVDLQPKLLRALQEREIYRLGGSEKISLDVRIIAATNRDLKQEIIQGNFRSDLYYRLNTGHIFIPPLRDRKEEIIPLMQMFLHTFSKEKNKKFLYIDKTVIKQLESHKWPGNIRELRNCVERAVLLHNDTSLKAEHLDFLRDEVSVVNRIIKIEYADEKLNMDIIKKKIIKALLDRFEGNISQTAEFLSITRNRIYSYIR